MALFEKGNPGRPEGIPNRSTREIRAMARSLVEDPIYLANLKERLDSGKIAPAVECMLYHYAYGKPPETLILPTMEDSPWAAVFRDMPKPQIVDVTAKYLSAENGGNGNGNGDPH